MFKNYLTIAFRNLLKFKFYTAINVFGLEDNINTRNYQSEERTRQLAHIAALITMLIACTGLTGLAASTTQTQNALLKSMFKLIEISTNTYQIVSPKHANYALDYDTLSGIPTLVMRDTRSLFRNTASAAYLTFTAEGSALRYPIAFYKAVRQNMLSRTVQVSDMYDGVIGKNTIPYVYFTNEADDSNIHHPFMIIASYGIPEGMTHLWDVTRPPGDGTPGTQYPDQKVTRNATTQTYMVKIPMKNYGEVETLTENTLTDNLATDERVSTFNHFNYASVSATGLAIDGVVIYPSYNNTLSFAQEVGEITSTGIHSGRGLGTHYHADGHSATGNGFNLYNAQDYENHTHPSVISFGFDGIAGYRKYLPGDTTSDGVGIALDDWGGHTHGVYGYHYHSETAAQTSNAPGSNNETFTAHMLPPRGAWRGKINDIAEFWDNRAPKYGGRPSRYQGIEER